MFRDFWSDNFTVRFPASLFPKLSDCSIYVNRACLSFYAPLCNLLIKDFRTIDVCGVTLFSIGGTLSGTPDGLPVWRGEGYSVSHQRFLPVGPAHWLVLPAASGLRQSNLHQHDVPADTTKLRRRTDACHPQQNSLQDSQGAMLSAYHRVSFSEQRFPQKYESFL